MVGFLLKKWFYDLWDNLLKIVLINLGLVLLFLLCITIYDLPVESPILKLLFLCISIIITITGLGTASQFVSGMSNFSYPEFRELVTAFKAIWKNGLFFAVVWIIIFLLLTAALPFYLSISGVFGVIGGLTIFWGSLFLCLASLYYFPLTSWLTDKPFDALKKAFFLFFENGTLTIFLAVVSIILLALSAFTAFLIPGVAGVLLLHQNAVKLLMFKYDYIEEQGGNQVDHIPWKKLLIEEKDRVGTRSIKNLIFPWKD